MQDLSYWVQCKDCGTYYDQLKQRNCSSRKCTEVKKARQRAVGQDPWHQCVNCRKWYQAPKQLELCPTCQAKHDAALARDRAQLEAMKGRVGG